MTDGQKLDLILSKMTDMQSDIGSLKADVATLKADVAGLKTDVAGLKTDVSILKTDMENVKKEISELKHMDAMIFDEVERVHEILNAHTADTLLHQPTYM
ncbi:hypothetical protein [Blautia sp. An81]|uniref:hypothetical protein n=1 Tax=Blautia sp. An81 TaxID=1965659 RepID=UPI000B3A67D0|nr:hypothetical protein [Blautia sp. An81]OUN30673.1 hypothetical protein B5G33_07675 [Blautia sp. An81]